MVHLSLLATSNILTWNLYLPKSPSKCQMCQRTKQWSGMLNLKKGLRRAKYAYELHLDENFSNYDAWRWSQGIRALTDYKPLNPGTPQHTHLWGLHLHIQQLLYLFRQLWKVQLRLWPLANLFCCATDSLLTNFISVLLSGCSDSDWKALQQTVNTSLNANFLLLMPFNSRDGCRGWNSSLRTLAVPNTDCFLPEGDIEVVTLGPAELRKASFL